MSSQIKTISTPSKKKTGGNYVLPATDDMTVKDLALSLGIKENEVDNLITTLADLLVVDGIKALGNATTLTASVEQSSTHQNHLQDFVLSHALCWGIVELKPRVIPSVLTSLF